MNYKELRHELEVFDNLYKAKFEIEPESIQYNKTDLELTYMYKDSYVQFRITRGNRKPGIKFEWTGFVRGHMKYEDWFCKLRGQFESPQCYIDKLDAIYNILSEYKF